MGYYSDQHVIKFQVDDQHDQHDNNETTHVIPTNNCILVRTFSKQFLAETKKIQAFNCQKDSLCKEYEIV